MPASTLLLVATDFSSVSDLALEQAIDLARALSARLEVLHVHQVSTTSVPPTLDIAPVPPSAKEVGAGEMALAERVERARAAGVAADGESRFGRTPDEIVRRAAELAPRMLVLGSHGHSRLRQALLGSVAETVVKNAPCPVLLVRGPRAEAD